MKRNMYTSASKNLPAYLSKVFTILFLVFIGTQASAQIVSSGLTISGIVKFSEDNEAAPGVNIYLKGATSTGTYSDTNGKFEFPRILKTGDVLVFSFIGRKSIEYVVPDGAVSPVEIVMGPELIEMVEDVLVEGDEPSRTSTFAKMFRKEKK